MCVCVCCDADCEDEPQTSGVGVWEYSASETGDGGVLAHRGVLAGEHVDVGTPLSARTIAPIPPLSQDPVHQTFSSLYVVYIYILYCLGIPN